MTDALDLYRRMLLIREFEQTMLAMSADGLIAGSVHPCVGQEAVPVGALAALRADDPVVATYRGHGWALACDLDPEALLAELAGRAAGINGGRGGSAYLHAPGTRFLGENSIVGAGLPVAAGAALAARVLGRDEVAVVSFGDGATNQGAAHEAMVFAVAESLPIVFVCENNEWSEMTPIRRTVPVPLVDRAAAYGMAAAAVDGADPRAVAEAVSKAAQRARRGDGPTFLECAVPRIRGHYQADVEHYRSPEDRQEAADRDPLPAARAALLAEGVDAATLDAAEHEVTDRMAGIRKRVEELPFPDPASGRHHVVATAAPARTDLPSRGPELAFGRAVNAALHEEMAARPEMVVFGEDVAVPGGVFGVTRNLRKDFGPARVFDTPISEAAILGGAVGASQRGLRPVVEIMWMDFTLVALDQLVNQAANVRYLSSGQSNAPLVVRTQQGATPGSCAQHSQSLEAILAHIPGLKVGLPATPHDAYAMTRAAIADDDPVVLIEARATYQETGPVDTARPVETVGGARLRRPGRDLLIVSWGRTVTEALAAAEALAGEGIQAGVIDLRWLAPLDFDLVKAELPRHDGKLLIVHEANRTGGFGAEIAARVAQECLYELDHPIIRLGAPDVRIPAAPALRAGLIPGRADIMAAATRIARGEVHSEGR